MSSLTDASAETALVEHLKGCIGTYKVAWPNVKFTRVVGTPYYRTAFIYPESERLTYSNTGQHKGIFQVDAMIPSNRGNILALTMARTVAAYFDNQKLIENGVTVQIIKTPTLGPEIQEVDWYGIPVSIFYTIMN